MSPNELQYDECEDIRIEFDEKPWKLCMSEDEPKTPALIDTVHTSELPVEVETEYGIKIWVDEFGEWLHPDQEVWSGDDLAAVNLRDVTLRICELCPVSERNDSDFTPIEPGDGLDVEREYQQTIERLRELAEKHDRDALNRAETEEAERLSQRLYVISEDVVG